MVTDFVVIVAPHLVINMPGPILQVELTTRIGRKPLSNFIVDESTVAEEAGTGRALCIGDCKEDRIVRHVCNATKNADRMHTIIAASSYDCCESIAFELNRMGIKWASPYKSARTLSYNGSRVYISVLEKLYLARDWHTCGFRPSIIHILDQKGITLQLSRNLKGEGRVRAENISVLKARYEAYRISLYPIYWTTEGCGCFPASHLCKCFSVDTLQYGNGRKVRTVGLLSHKEAISERQRRNTKLQEIVHDAYISHQNLVFVFASNTTSPDTVLKHFADQQNYSLVDVSSIFTPREKMNLRDFRSTIYKYLLDLNRQFVVLVGAEQFWSRFQVGTALTVLRQICRHLTLICALSDHSLIPIVRKEVDRFNDGQKKFNPTIVDCTTL